MLKAVVPEQQQGHGERRQAKSTAAGQRKDQQAGRAAGDAERAANAACKGFKAEQPPSQFEPPPPAA